MRRRHMHATPALTIALMIAAIPAPAAAQTDAPAPTSAIADCRRITEDAGRLACYDRAAAALTPPRWSGRLSYTTEPFEIDRPTLLRFDSEGVIFVMYLKDAAGEVVQNLHHAGTGEGRYLIAQPGRYSLQINGAEGWRIWLDPVP